MRTSSEPRSRRHALKMIAGFAGALVTTPALSQSKIEVDCQLVLAVDCSASVNQQRYDVQKKGIVDVLLSDRFSSAIEDMLTRRIGISYMEWSSAGHSKNTGWFTIGSRSDAREFASRVSAFDRIPGIATHVASAMRDAHLLIQTSPYDAMRSVIDVSGDGRENGEVHTVTRATADAIAANGVVINGLPIIGDPGEHDLDVWYRDHVKAGPGSFVIAAAGFEDFSRAFMSKIVQEIG